MQRVADYLFLLRDYVVLFLAVLLSLLLVASGRGPAVEAMRGFLADRWGSVEARFVWVSQLSGAIVENRELRQRNLDLAMINAHYREAQEENTRLRALLKFRDDQPGEFVPAVVTGLGRQRFTNALTVNVGQEDGVRKNMPVLTDRGLVGKIITVGQRYSVVQILIDINFGVSVRVRRSRELGILKGKGGQWCTLEFIAKSADVAVGDTVTTSGHGELYPPHVLIGTVTMVTDRNPGLFKTIDVRPMIDLKKIEEVFILVNRPEAEFALDAIE